MQAIKVEAVTKEPREYKGQKNWGVKLPGDGGWVTLYREKKPERGETIDVNITERNVKGRIYVDAFPVMPPLAQPLNGQAGAGAPATPAEVAPKKDERITWDDYREVAKAAHNLALVMEPDLPPSPTPEKFAESYIDRSPARMAFVNTTLIAYSNGKFTVPKDEDEYTPPPADDIPF